MRPFFISLRGAISTTNPGNMSRHNLTKAQIVRLVGPRSAGIAMSFAGVSFQPGNHVFHTPSAIHCGVRIHNSKSWLVVDSTSGRSATSRPAAGLRPLHPLISIPDAAHAATVRIVVRHKMKFSRTPERWTHTVPGTGFASVANRQSLLLVKSNTL